MDAIIITIGDEILSGATVDTNAAFISRELIGIGIDVKKRCSVGDNAEDMEREIRDGLANYDVVLTTGGLGPTEDDITKGVIARVFDTELIENPKIAESLEQRYRELGIKMSDLARGMALQPKGATLLENSLGTAPGILFDRDGKLFCSMAGVPSEMRKLMNEKLIPYLKERGTGRAIIFRSISTFGIPESKLAEKIDDAGFKPEGAKLAYLPSYAGVVLRLRAEAETEEKAQEVIDRNFEKLYEIVEEYVFSTDSERLLDTVTSTLMEKAVTVATAESCTGGLIAKMLTDQPGSSVYFLQGAVTYSNESKINRLGVRQSTLESHGAVSEEVAREMAEGMRLLAGSDYAVSVTGIAGPGGGTEEKPVGLVYIGVADEDGVVVKRARFSGDRDVVRVRTANTALYLLRQRILGKYDEDKSVYRGQNIG